MTETNHGPERRVLLVEDNPVHARILKTELRDLFTLHEAQDYGGALQQLRDHFDMVIVDLGIPREPGQPPSNDEGLKLIRQIRHKERRSTVVVVVSGGLLDDLQQQLDNLDVKYVFEKPFELGNFRAKVETLLSHQAA